jgi:hypothetical protein
MTDAKLQEIIAALKLAQRSLETVRECIEFLGENHAYSAVRSIAIRLHVLAFKAGSCANAPAPAPDIRPPDVRTEIFPAPILRR